MTQTAVRPQGVYLSPLDGHPIILDEIDWDKIITEDDAPVDSWDTEQHIGLLTDPLYDSWRHSVYGDQFLVAADVGVFFDPNEPPVVPDVFQEQMRAERLAAQLRALGIEPDDGEEASS